MVGVVVGMIVIMMTVVVGMIVMMMRFCRPLAPSPSLPL